MVATPVKQKKYTAAEYLELEEKAEFKSEFFDGEIIPMAGASANHNKIVLNLCRLLPLEIGGQEYEVFMSDMRLWIPSKQHYTYPDVTVVRGEPIYVDSPKQTMLTNPCLIIEVTSASTESYDKSNKFDFYRSIPEFEEYILIDQKSYKATQWTRLADGRWILADHYGEDHILQLESIDFEISFKDLYKRVMFETAEK
ncbi:MAG: Uma2 family endonuclease [Limnothrix sp. RL_2_0]|nr:Uma2 family endonuclease [Limnothrix sp. RL_2_0]